MREKPKRDDYMAKQSTEAVMKKTIPQSEEFERYWNGVHKNSLSLKKYLPETMGSYKDVIDGIKEFYGAYPTAPIYKEKVIRPLLEDWIDNIADFFNERYYDDSHELDHYVETDKCIEMLKLLQEREGISKEGLHAALGVSEKTIQKDLRAISPSLGKSDYELKIGGNPVHAAIKEKRLSDNRKLFFTPNTVHPLVLLPNIMQVGTMLKALASEKDSEVAQYVAADIWLQLSDYCKSRIRDIYCKKYPEMKLFLSMVENRIRKGYLFGYSTEREMDRLSIEEELMRAYKANRLCNLELEINGEIIELQNQKISFLKNEYTAKSTDGSGKSVVFIEKNVVDIELCE